jgi:hypothetical protein
MVKNTWESFMVLGLGVLAGVGAACGPSRNGSDDDGASGGPCGPSSPQTRCNGNKVETCVDGQYQVQETCSLPEICTTDLGCAACDPAQNTTCQGNSVYVCNDDGTLGGEIMSCGIDPCTNGTCGAPTDDCSEESKLIYVVDTDYNLLSFDPKLLPGNAFTLIGKLTCPAGPILPGAPVGGTKATPFSMSVDRSGRAWVLYSSGEIFWVSTADASCQKSPWTVGTQGFELFGMGFVTDTPGGTSEKLYIAGGARTLNGGNLGVVDPQTMQATKMGALPQAENSPELTGNGKAELWGYYPATTKSVVARMNKTSAQSEEPYDLPALSGTVTAWAFAHHGGRYYVFVTTMPAFGPEVSKVLRLDPTTKMTEAVVPMSPYRVVGAGVSTCAPVVIDG